MTVLADVKTFRTEPHGGVGTPVSPSGQDAPFVGIVACGAGYLSGGRIERYIGIDLFPGKPHVKGLVP